MLKFWVTNIVFAAGLLLFFFFKTTCQLSWWYLFAWVNLYLLMQFLGAYFIGLNFHLVSQNKLPAQGNVVALTFDDGPESPATGRVLDVLKKHDVKATFFLIGKNIPGREALVERMLGEGHGIGNHSHSHAFWFDLWPTKKVSADILQCQQLIGQYAGSSKLFRPPYGVTNPNIRRALKKLGLRSVGWSIRSYDTSARDIEKINKRILDRLQPGAIILLHDRLACMPDLLEQLIPAIRQKNYTFGVIK